MQRMWPVMLVAALGCKDAATTECVRDGMSRRTDWLVTAQDLGDQLIASPHDVGIRAEGACREKLAAKRMNCSDAMIRQADGQNPLFAQAHKLGFTQFVCLEAGVDGVVRRRVEKPLDWVVATP